MFGNAPPDVTLLDFCLWGCKRSETHKIKTDTREELLARSLDAAARPNKREVNADERNVILTHEVQSTVKLTVRFTNRYCELQQICQFFLTNLLFSLLAPELYIFF